MTTFVTDIDKLKRIVICIPTKNRISKKESKIIKLKGGPGSGHKGHKGIPGHQGGSLPGDISSHDPEHALEYYNYAHKNYRPIGNSVIEKLKAIQKDKRSWYSSDEEFNSAIEVDFDILITDKEKFDRYNLKWGLGLPSDMFEKLYEENKQMERKMLESKNQWEYSNIIPDSKDYKSLMIPLSINVDKYGNTLEEVENKLHEYPFFFGTGTLPDDTGLKFANNVLSAIEHIPEVKMLVSKGVLSDIHYFAVPYGTASATTEDRIIKVRDDIFGILAPVFVHELGHALSEFVIQKNLVPDRRLSDTFGKGKCVSQYAFTNYEEDFAETFCAYLSKDPAYFNNSDLKAKFDFIKNCINKVNEL